MEELIRRYFQEELSDSERQEVISRSENDPEFAALMEQYRSARNGIRLAERDRLKQKLVELEADKKTSSRFMRIAIAASVALVIGVGGIILWNQQSTSPENLFAEYYEPYPNLYAPITRDADSLSSLEKAFADYELGHYKDALKGFDASLANKENHDVLFYKAMSLMQLDRDEKAINVLRSIDQTKTNYRPQILWYEAMLFLKDSKPKKALSKLEELKNLQSGFKTEKVQELINQLK